jgi:hypothetical protein
VSKGPPTNSVNVASKGFSFFVSPLFAAFTGNLVSVAFKGVNFTVGLRLRREGLALIELSNGRRILRLEIRETGTACRAPMERAAARCEVMERSSYGLELRVL